jgi:hypothetical protein
MPLTAIMSYVIRSPNDATVDMRGHRPDNFDERLFE